MATRTRRGNKPYKAPRAPRDFENPTKEFTVAPGMKMFGHNRAQFTEGEKVQLTEKQAAYFARTGHIEVEFNFGAQDAKDDEIEALRKQLSALADHSEQQQTVIEHFSNGRDTGEGSAEEADEVAAIAETIVAVADETDIGAGTVVDRAEPSDGPVTSEVDEAKRGNRRGRRKTTL